MIYITLNLSITGIFKTAHHLLNNSNNGNIIRRHVNSFLQPRNVMYSYNCGSQVRHHHESVVAQLCPTLWDPMDCTLPGSSVHRIFQARILEWVAISFSRGSFGPRDRTQVSRIASRFFTIWATRESLKTLVMCQLMPCQLILSCPTEMPSLIFKSQCIYQIHHIPCI